MKRRNFLKVIGTTFGGTLLSSCSLEKKTSSLIPYLVPPEDGVIPGEAIYYPSTCTECPANCGIDVRVIYDYPIKLEGIQNHPINDGALCVRGQSSLSRLYHPDRIKNPLLRDQQGDFNSIGWEEAITNLTGALNRSKANGYSSYYLSGRTTGTLSELIDSFCNTFGINRVPEFEYFSHGAVRTANSILFDKKEIPSYRIENADFLLTIGVDILETFLSPVQNAVQLTRAQEKNHLTWFHIEPHVSLTGFQADEKITLNPGSEFYLLSYILQSCLKEEKYRNKLPAKLKEVLPRLQEQEIIRKTGIASEELKKIVHTLLKAANPLLIIGNVSTAHVSGLEAAMLAGVIQWITGMTDSVIDFSRSENYSNVGTFVDFEQFTNQLGQNKSGVVFIAKTDPVSNIPKPQVFKNNLKEAELRVGLTDFLTDTAQECDLILPLSHTIESWGDTVPRKGLRTLIQPAIKPLFQTYSEGDILLQLLAKESDDRQYQQYQKYIFHQWSVKFGNTFQESFISKGYLEENVTREKIVLREKPTSEYFENIELPKLISKPVLIVVPSLRSFDGRSQNLQLLEEIPDPVTTISYGKWVSISKKTAEKEQLSDKQEISIATPGWTAKLPVKIQNGLPENVYMVHRAMVDSGFLQVQKDSGEGNWYLPKVSIKKTGALINYPVLAGSTSQTGRGIIPKPHHGKEEHHQRHGERISLYPEHTHEEYQWTMAVDLARCTGCSACVAACYIENNISIVGGKEHLKGRELSWLRIEPYYDEGDSAVFLPMMCHHCEYAPCEPVCPVFATNHNIEGLNTQIYNRCVGTRYCAINCPYKVRRFNWFTYKRKPPLDKMVNPEMSVRTKGIMEKCTFCVQRIRKAHDVARDESRKIRDGEIVPACAQTCPTRAIVFGNILDKESKVSKLVHSERAYRIFEYLGTDPSVYYLQKKTKKGKA